MSKRRRALKLVGKCIDVSHGSIWMVIGVGADEEGKLALLFGDPRRDRSDRTIMQRVSSRMRYRIVSHAEGCNDWNWAEWKDFFRFFAEFVRMSREPDVIDNEVARLRKIWDENSEFSRDNLREFMQEEYDMRPIMFLGSKILRSLLRADGYSV